MKMDWKKPWTVLFWVLSRERFTPEEGPGSERASRFGPGGFLRWLFASESASFREEEPMEPHRSQFGPDGFWKWLFLPEDFVQEPELKPSEPRFGGRGFFAWLFGSEWREAQADPEGIGSRAVSGAAVTGNSRQCGNGSPRPKERMRSSNPEERT